MTQTWLKNQFDQNPNSVFINWQGRLFTFSEIYYNARTQAESLLSQGIRKRARVGLFLSDPFDFVEVYLACMEIGAISVPVSPLLKSTELKRQLDLVQPDVIMTDWKLAGKLKDMDHPCSAFEELPVNQCAIQGDESAVNRTPEDILSILFTSGTTGNSKGVQLTHNNFLSSGKAWHKFLKFSEKDLYLSCLPLTHIGGLSVITRSLIYGFQVLLTEKFNAGQINKLLDEYPVTLISLVPTMVQRILDDRGDMPFPASLRAIILGGGPAPDSLIERCSQLKLPIIKSYGMTETCSGVTAFYLRDHPEKSHSAGQPFHNVSLKIKNGEIHISGPIVMRGYVNDEDCGDIHNSHDHGKIDPDGFLTLDMRREDLIITGGENVNPSEVASVVKNHHAVRECAVLGMTDDTWGQRIVVFVSLKEKSSDIEKELRLWCKTQLADYKIPKEFVVVDLLPRNELEKIDYHKLRDIYPR